MRAMITLTAVLVGCILLTAGASARKYQHGEGDGTPARRYNGHRATRHGGNHAMAQSAGAAHVPHGHHGNMGRGDHRPAGHRGDHVPLLCKLVTDGKVTEYPCPHDLPCRDESVSLPLGDCSAHIHMCDVTNIEDHVRPVCLVEVDGEDPVSHDVCPPRTHCSEEGRQEEYDGVQARVHRCEFTSHPGHGPRRDEKRCPPPLPCRLVTDTGSADLLECPTNAECNPEGEGKLVTIEGKSATLYSCVQEGDDSCYDPRIDAGAAQHSPHHSPSDNGRTAAHGSSKDAARGAPGGGGNGEQHRPDFGPGGHAHNRDKARTGGSKGSRPGTPPCRMITPTGEERVNPRGCPDGLVCGTEGKQKQIRDKVVTFYFCEESP